MTLKKIGMAAVLAASLLFPRYAPAEPAPVAKNYVFVGEKATSSTKTLDTLVDYRHDSGAQLSLENFSTPWNEKPAYNFNAGARSPKFINGLFRVDGVFDFNQKLDTWGYTAFAEAFPVKDLTVRAGAIQNDAKGILGGFAGAKYIHPFFSVEGNLLHDGSKIGLTGYASTQLGNVYLSAGGNLQNSQLGTLTGWINPGKFGIFNKVFLDFEKDAQSGLFLVADKSTRDRSVFDFKQHVYTGAEMQGVATSGILDCWPAPDGMATDHLAGFVNWSNDASKTVVDGRLIYRPVPSLFVGVGPKYRYDKVQGQSNASIETEVYAEIPGTPAFVYLTNGVDLRTGNYTPFFALAAKGKF